MTSLPRALVSVLAASVLGACAGHPLRGADPDRRIVLPRDDAAHDDAQTEFWHFHGHVRDAEGRVYDWFLAFIQQHTDLDRVLALPVGWFVDPFQVAYFTVTDRSGGTFFARERHNFPDTWAAHAASDRLALRHGGWSAISEDGQEIVLDASSLGGGINLRLRPEKQPSFAGGAGYLYVPPRSSTHYYSRPRMTATGTLTVSGESRRVAGLGWFKHQWGFMYDERLKGWVWFGVQLSSGQEIEIGVIFEEDQRIAQGSFAMIQEQDGTLTQLDLRSVGIVESGEVWRSPRTDTVYPIGWTLVLPERGTLRLKAAVPDQEMVVFPANLWAGGLAVSGIFDGERVSGHCFAEVVGSDEPFGRTLIASGKPSELPPDKPGRSALPIPPPRPVSSSPRSPAEVSTATAAATASAPPVSRADREAQTIFQARCAPCHGSAGRGDGPAAAGLVPRPRDLSQPSWQGSITDAQIERVIRDGGASIGLSPVMPAHPDLSGQPQRMSALRRLVRSFARGARR